MLFSGRLSEKNYVTDCSPRQGPPGNSSGVFLTKISFYEDDIYFNVKQFLVAWETV